MDSSRRSISIARISISWWTIRSVLEVCPLSNGLDRFKEEFVEQMDLFDVYPDLIDSEDVDLYTLNTLVNLGPLQAFLNRKWRRGKSLTAQQEHDDGVEAEVYRRN